MYYNPIAYSSYLFQQHRHLCFEVVNMLQLGGLSGSLSHTHAGIDLVTLLPTEVTILSNRCQAVAGILGVNFSTKVIGYFFSMISGA